MIGRHSGGEACQITNGNLGHALTAVMTALPYSVYKAVRYSCRSRRAAAGWSAVHCVYRLVCSRENRETYNCDVLYVCMLERQASEGHQAGSILLDLSSYSDTEVRKESKIKYHILLEIGKKLTYQGRNQQ